MENRIKELRKSKGWTQPQLAEHAGTSAQMIGMLEGGKRNLTVDWMDRIAKALGCKPIDLIVESGSPSQFQEPAQQRPIDSMLPIIGSVQAGVFQPALQYDGDWERVPFITPSGYNSKDFYILRVVGDSMDKHYPDGTMIVCCKLRAYNGALVEGRHIIVERRDEYSDGSEATVKELVHDIANSQWLLMPKSSNPKYKPIPIPNGNGDTLDFAGRDDLSITGVVYAKYELNRNF